MLRVAVSRVSGARIFSGYTTRHWNLEDFQLNPSSAFCGNFYRGGGSVTFNIANQQTNPILPFVRAPLSTQSESIESSNIKQSGFDILETLETGELAASLQPTCHSSSHLAKYSPWVSTSQLESPPHAKRRMSFLMQTLEQEKVRAAEVARPIPPFKSGDILEVHMLVPEAGRQDYLFRGVCIARYNKAIRSSFKIYNVLPESGGFVQHIPLYMPDLLGIKVIGEVRAKRKKLYYLKHHEDGRRMSFNPPIITPRQQQLRAEAKAKEQQSEEMKQKAKRKKK